MTTPSSKIAFEVETSRVLEILSREIYDSPLAMLRENVQNGYDAILMRNQVDGMPLSDGKITIDLNGTDLVITDNGLGMTEEVLRNNFWKAGSSGKRSELAEKSGVIGTFGIGAMANFGVCSSLRVETRAVNQTDTLISVAERATLSIAHECITLERVQDNRPVGTTIKVTLDAGTPLTKKQCIKYLEPYVRFIPVAVSFNGEVISQKSLEENFVRRTKDIPPLGVQPTHLGQYLATIECFADSNGVVSCIVKDISFGGQPVRGEMVLQQGQGQLMGLRNYFGLAPAPISGCYQFGGVANLTILHPTAGREALSRESISHLSSLVDMAEWAASQCLSNAVVSDRNNSFIQYIVNQNTPKLGGFVTVEVQPGNQSVALSQLESKVKSKGGHYYTGRDANTIDTFASDASPLVCISQSNPRRNLQLKYVKDVAGLPEVPDTARILHVFGGKELTFEEAALLVRIATTLNDDYLLPNAMVRLAKISHKVPIFVEKQGDSVVINIARDLEALRPVLKCYLSAPEVFTGFVKDFVRGHVFKRISEYVPSSTREGAEALYKILHRNKELYRIEQSDLGDLEPLLSDYLMGDKSLGEVLKEARTHVKAQSFRFRSADVGSIEKELPDVVSAPPPDNQSPDTVATENEPAPAIMRPDLDCKLKILSAGARYPQLNNFEVFLGLSDRLHKLEGDFFHFPHTTKVIWAGHRVVYIFGHASGQLTLYYDIEMPEPLANEVASGAVIPTTTIVTRNRIYVPVPAELVADFKITDGAKEFYVRFDTVASKGTAGKA